MLQLYGGSPAVFTAARMSGSDVVWFALLVLLGPVVILTVVDTATAFLRGRARSTAHHVITGVASFPVALLALRSFPGPWPVGLLIALTMSTVVSILLSRLGTVATWAVWMSPLAPAVFVLFLFSSQAVIWEAKADVIDLPAATTTSGVPLQTPVTVKLSDVSVLWLQLDEAPLWPLLGTDGNINARRFPGFAQLAQHSTWYRNALGLSQTTVDAVPAMLSGTKPVTGRAPVYSNYRRSLFSLAYGHRAMDVHEIATAVCPKEACATVSVSGSDAIAQGGVGAGSPDPAPTTTAHDPRSATQSTQTAVVSPDWGGFLRDAAVVLGHKLLPASLRDRLPRIDEGWGGFGADGAGEDDGGEVSGDGSDGTTAPTATSSSVPTSTLPDADVTEPSLVESKKNTVRGWERDGARSQVPVVRGMIERAARSALPTVHFAHVLLPHRPWQLTPDMRTTRYVRTDKRGPTVEDRVRDEYQAFLAQYVATDSLVLQLVNNMRRSANWDRTMIIVTADHGIAFEPGESKRKDINPARADTLEEIYRVPLFVKYPGQAEPSVSDCPAQGFDMMPTVVAATGLDAGWEFDGVDLRTTCPLRNGRTIWWDKGSTALSSGFDAVTSTVARFDRWVPADGDVDAIARTTGHGGWFDARIPAAAARDATVRGWTLRDKALFANVSTEEFARVPLQVDGGITVSARQDETATGLIVMDGRVVAVIPELSGMRPGTNEWRSLVLPSSLTKGRHSPLLYVARRSPQSPQVTLVGPPG